MRAFGWNWKSLLMLSAGSHLHSHVRSRRNAIEWNEIACRTIKYLGSLTCKSGAVMALPTTTLLKG
jgi:hypothetical protein